jgi:hypothetical protein
MPAHPTLSPQAPTPALVRESAQTFPGHPDQVGQARAFLARILDGCPAADDAVLLASELAANAVAHSASGQPGGSFTLRARLYRDQSVVAEVEDQGSTWDGNISAAKPPHGLYLLRKLSADCGAWPGQHGWITWFTIASTATEQAPRL